MAAMQEASAQATPAPMATVLPIAAVSSTASASGAATPVVRTPKAPGSQKPEKKNRPSPLLNLEVRSPPSTPATATPASGREKARRRPPALAAVPSNHIKQVSPSVDTSFVVQCDQWAGAKGRAASPGGGLPRLVGEAPAQGLSPDTSTERCNVTQFLTLPMLPLQPGSEGASTTASSAGDWSELQGPEELEHVCRLGQGSSGVVEKHRHIRTGKELAIKIIHASGIAEPQRKAILLELRTFYRCRNPHIVDFYGAFFHENNIHIGLEYMDAGALSSVLDIRCTVPEHLLANITWQVLDGLEYLHCEMHVIHRDIKPSNLLLRSSGVVKITDFGVSGELEDDLRESQCKVTWVGTIYYMSPERAQGHGYRYDSDMWSLGLTLIECLCGRFPYLDSEACMKQLSFWELMRRIVEQEAPRLPAGDVYSSQAQDFIQQVLQKDSRNRPGSALMKSHAWISNSASQADVATWIKESGVVGDLQAAASASPTPSASSGLPPRTTSSSSTSPVKNAVTPNVFIRPLDAGTSPTERGFENRASKAQGDSTPMEMSVRGGANPFSMSRASGSDLSTGGSPSPFAQLAPGLEASDLPGSGSRSAQNRSAGSMEADTPMGQSLRGGDNPFRMRAGPTSPGVETASSPSVCSDRGPLVRGMSADTPMSQSLRGGENPFAQRGANSESAGYPA